LRDFAQVEAGGLINGKLADSSLCRLDIDSLGLDTMDRNILTAIIENYDGGPVGVQTLAAAIGEDCETLEEVYEPYLLQIGFLQRTPRGRSVTKKAYRHLNIPVPQE
jgi:Holliday junction DNA helicase RuvB